MATPVLATKLFAPTRRPQLVARRRLAEQLDAALDDGHRLTLVSAPAGFGKTTLLSDWLADLGRRRTGTRVGWVSLDDGDNDLTRLMHHVVAALAGVGIEVSDNVLGSPHTASATVAMAALVNDVARVVREEPDRRWVLVLDDYHVVVAAEVHEAVTFLLDRLPDQVLLLLTTRADPPLPLARLRGRGQLTEVRAADLRFTPSEATEFLNGVMGLVLADADVRALEERTEGWITGLQLAALSLRGMSEPADITQFIQAFTGSHRFVVDFLADEVLTRQPAPVLDFLLRTAVLDRLTGSLCDAVTGREDGTLVLEQLERDNLFLVPLDTRRCWYRYHHLFADVLLARLLAGHPGEVPRLHQRASAWFHSHHLVADAVRHALAAEDFEPAAHMMEEAVPELRRTRQDSLLLAWMRSLPDSVVRRSPVLSIVTGWSLLMAGDLDAVEYRLGDAEAALAAGDRDPDLAATWADTEDLRTAPAMIAVYRASLDQARGDVGGTERHARCALALAGPDDHFIRGAGAGFLALAAWAAGDVQNALSTFGEAVRSLHAAGNLVDELDSTVVRADMWVAAGRPSRAGRLLETALQAALGMGEPYPRATADLHVGLAELDRERDDLPGAERHLQTARELGERASITENRYRWFVVMAQVHAARGEYDVAARLLDRAEARYRPGFYPDLRPIAAFRTRLRITDGDLSAAVAWAHERGLTVDDEPTYLREYEHLTLVRLLLAQDRGQTGSGSPVDAALDLLERLHAAAAAAGRGGSVREIRVLQALAHDARGDRPAALRTLERALVEAPEPDSCTRLYLDEGAPMLALLRHAATATGARQESGGHGVALRQHARRLLERVQTAGEPAGRQPVDPLSQRELQVLRLLDSELTGPEIARELYVSVNTLRTHTKRIYTKLDVNTRVGAVRRGRERGLLQPPRMHGSHITDHNVW